MAKKRKYSKEKAEAGARNLAKWWQDHPEGGNLKHGAYSSQIRQRYSDKRTTEGKQLAVVMKNLADDLGGRENLTAAQSLLLDSIRSKLIVILQIGKYVDKQIDVLNSKGELLPCLGRGFTTYSESLRRDIEALFAIKKKPAIPSYEKTVRALQGGKTL